MSGSFSDPMSICVRRRNPLRIPRRDILVQASDTPVLSATIYQQDTDTAPIDITGASFVLSIYREPEHRRGWFWWDYGFVRSGMPLTIAQWPGMLVDPANGRVDFAPVGSDGGQATGALNTWINGRFWYELTMSYGQQPTTGIGEALSYPLSPVYGQGNYTVLCGSIDFPPGAYVPSTQLPELLGGIGISP